MRIEESIVINREPGEVFAFFDERSKDIPRTLDRGSPHGPRIEGLVVLRGGHD